MRERRPGYWELRVYVGVDPVTRRQRYAVRCLRGTRREADRALRALAQEVDASQHRSTEGTLGMLLDRWYQHASPGWSPTTRSQVGLVIRRRVAPALGDRRLSELRAAHLDEWYRSLAAEGLAPATIRKAHNVIRRALRQGVQWGWLPGNVAASASPPPVRQAPICPPAPQTVRRLVEAAEGRGSWELATLAALAASTGARRGELVGLRRSDVDLAGRSITIRRAVVIDEQAGGGAWLVKDTKGHQARRIAIGDATARRLEQAMDRAEERAQAADVALVDDPWVLSRAVNGAEPWRPDLASLAWRRLCADLGVKCRLHDLRHFTATQLLDAGIPVRTVAGRLGHRNAATTLNVYAGWVPARDQEAADLIEGRLEDV